MFQSINALAARYGRVTSGRTFVPQIDGLRFLAILPVLLHHSGLRGLRATGQSAEGTYGVLMPHGHIGVDLFFFISGLIISYPFLTHRSPKIGDFFLRRVTRLEPPYFMVMIGCFLLLFLSGHQPKNAPGFEASDGTLLESLGASLIYMHGVIFDASPRLNPPAWSLEVEIQFYILSPLILFLLVKLAPHARMICALALAVGGIFLAHFLLEVADIHVFYYTFLGHSYGFLLGIAVAQYAALYNPFEASKSHWFDLFFAVSMVVLFLTSGIEKSGSWDRDLLRLACFIGLYLGAARGIYASRLLSIPILTLIGGACYSIYLTHVPVMQIAANVLYWIDPALSQTGAIIMGWVFLVPIATIAGLVFYLLVERPCMSKTWPQDLWAFIKRTLTGERRSVG